ncbi:hypothetical protein PsorP6_005445 [Peronosclerospora sorghi]|uniref:Uncharacterized protein n=1 Tax=Peronosclerospora sorghi TaxID=230839 RepID=A0ACC0W3Y1_9STRA|nr:hypothetical protein PsorP6_005445 [Peronosclerospora sorghi]
MATLETTVQSLHKFATPLDGTQFDMGVTLRTGSFGRVRFATHKISGPPTPSGRLKFLKKSEIIRLQQVDHMLSEKSILLCMNYPFIVNLAGTYQDTNYLYMVLEYVINGEFFTHLRKARRFSNNTENRSYETVRMSKNGVEDIKKHKFFADVVWEDLLGRKRITPIIPGLATPTIRPILIRIRTLWRMRLFPFTTAKTPLLSSRKRSRHRRRRRSR